MTPTIRRATADDAARLALIGAATFLETFADLLDGAAIVAHCASAHAPAAYEALLADAQTAAWVAETARGAPVGYAMMTLPDLPGVCSDGGDLELKRIYSLSRWHGTGLGSRMMDIVARAAAERGAARLALGVFANNDRAIGFYRRQGFEEIGTRRFRVGDQLCDDLVMARPIGMRDELWMGDDR